MNLRVSKDESLFVHRIADLVDLGVHRLRPAVLIHEIAETGGRFGRDHGETAGKAWKAELALKFHIPLTPASTSRFATR